MFESVIENYMLHHDILNSYELVVYTYVLRTLCIIYIRVRTVHCGHLVSGNSLRLLIKILKRGYIPKLIPGEPVV